MNNEINKNQPIKISVFILSIIFLMISCSEKSKDEVNEKDILNEVLNTYNVMYNSYAKGTDEFFNYFEKDLVRVTPSGKIKKGVEVPKSEWNDYLRTHSV
ncbi:MAG TPA: hypothetical protein VLM43_15470, partial [Desulfobacterales bacterium]|nr:hypothetical protein [Desulfobacterales bacterium]